MTENETRTDVAPIIARAFHEAYEALAPDFGYRTREASAKPWDEVPAQNKALMTATAQRLLDTGMLCGPEPEGTPERGDVPHAIAPLAFSALADVDRLHVPQPGPSAASAMAEELRATLDSLTDRALAGGVITEDEAAEYRQLAGPGETLREQLDGLRERFGNLAAGLDMAAQSTRPSKKSEIEAGCARAIQGILADSERRVAGA